MAVSRDMAAKTAIKSGFGYWNDRSFRSNGVAMGSFQRRVVAQEVEHSAVKVWIPLHGGLMPHGRCICSLGYFLFQCVVHNWSMKGCGMCCSACGNMDIKDPLLLIGKSNQCGNSGFPLKKYVTRTMCLMSNIR